LLPTAGLPSQLDEIFCRHYSGTQKQICHLLPACRRAGTD
jgi:hypothetical protein